MEQATITRQGYKEVCPYCKKVFESTSENEVKHNYLAHLNACKVRQEHKQKEVKKSIT